ncbi:unnamed protein product, partial [Prorocentrum cordatum]
GRKNRRTKRRTTTRQKEREREAEAGRLAGRKRGGNRFLDRLLDSSLFGRARQMRAELPRTHYHQTSARVFYTNPAEVWVTPAWKSLYTRLS